MATDFFPQRPDAHPMIYAYEDTNPQYQGLLKVGYTAIDVDKRVAQQYPTKRPDGSIPYRIVYRESAMYPDGSSFTDHDVHRVLKRKEITGMGGEWFRCTVDDVRAAVLAVKNHAVYKFKRYEDASLSYTGIDRHEGENRGGWDTVITDADYNSMFALQQASMEAPIPSVDDLPEKPFLDFAEAVRDMDQPKEEKQIAEKPAAYGRHLEKPRYTPSVPKPAEPAPHKQVDLSRVVVGSQLRHKAFGMGTVKEIQGGLIVVVFGETEKKFQFPGALLQGFLSLPE